MGNAKRLRGLCLAGLALTILAAPVVAQDDGKAKGDPEKGIHDGHALGVDIRQDVPAGFLAFGPGIRISAAMQLLAVPNPVSVSAVRLMAALDGNSGPLLHPEWT